MRVTANSLATDKPVALKFWIELEFRNVDFWGEGKAGACHVSAYESAFVCQQKYLIAKIFSWFWSKHNNVNLDNGCYWAQWAIFYEQQNCARKSVKVLIVCTKKNYRAVHVWLCWIED